VNAVRANKVRFPGIWICLPIFLAVQVALPSNPDLKTSRIPMNAKGIVDVRSKHSAVETVARLESLLKAKGIKIFALIDQAAEAKAVGLTMRPTVLLIFGDPKAGTPLMQRYPSLALDLPLKVLVWESKDGAVWLSYNSPEFLQKRHGLDTPPFGVLGNLVAAATE
jgi:uncharacterized protein (DUF302 family)